MNNGLDDIDYGVIGRFVVSFGTLEHELLRAVIAVYGGVDIVGADVKLNDEVLKAMGQPFGARLKLFVEAFTKFGGDEQWLKDFSVKMDEAGRFRNHFEHGQWKRQKGGKLSCEFYSRAGVKEGTAPQVFNGDLVDIQSMTDANVANAALLAQLSANFAPTSQCGC